MSNEKGKLASWALKLIVAIVAAVIAFVGQAIVPGNVVSAGALLVALILLVWGAIEYLLTKRQS